MKIPNLASLYQSGTSYFCSDCQSARYGPSFAARRTSLRIVLRSESYLELARCQVRSIICASCPLVGKVCCAVCVCPASVRTTKIPVSKRSQGCKEQSSCLLGLAIALLRCFGINRQ